MTQRHFESPTRRALLGAILSASFAGAIPVAPASGRDPPRDRGEEGALLARPAASPASPNGARSGLLAMNQPHGRDALIYVPPSYSAATPAPLLVMLHGATGMARDAIGLVRSHADRLGVIILAPSSVATTWDVIARRRFGRDVTVIDALLSRLFDDHAIASSKIAIGGFSDGASYALSLGLNNGNLFSRILAFSPGLAAPTRQEGRPRIFVSHGLQDRVLPIEMCSRRLVPTLRRAGYEVDYVEFEGGHAVPAPIAAAAVDAFATA